MDNRNNTDFKELLAFVMHDLREITAMIRDSARNVSLAMRGNRLDEPNLRHHSSVIVEQVEALSAWLAIADMHIDPEKFTKEPLRRLNFHKLLFKAFANFKRIAKKKHIGLSLIGEGDYHLNAHPVIDVLPYILLDNATKYSPEHSTVETILDSCADTISMRMESMGPLLTPEECESVLTKGVRGRNAEAMTKVGTGQGLALARTICNYHEGSITVKCGNEVCMVNKVPFAHFSVAITLPKGLTSL